MIKYYLNNKSIDYVCETLNLDKDKIKKLNVNGNNEYIYIQNTKDNVNVLYNYPKDIEIVVDKDDDIEELKRRYGIKHNLGVGDVFIVSSSEKYIVKPLDTFDKITSKLGVTKEYLMRKNNLKTEKVFVGQILIV